MCYQKICYLEDTLILFIYTVDPQLSEPRLSRSQIYLARDTSNMQLLHQCTYSLRIFSRTRSIIVYYRINVLPKHVLH